MTALRSLLPLLLLACWGGAPEAGRRGDHGHDGKKKDYQAFQRAPDGVESEVKQEVHAPKTVVLVIADTVRADHLSLCGYGRPTSPTLEHLVQQPGASFTCHAYAPGTWTLPSHASYFTGAYTTEHDLLNKGRPLNPSFETLAEIFQHAGYQTAMVSANPTLSKASGVWQGFDQVNVPKGTSDDFRGHSFPDELTKALQGLDPVRPLFLVINLFDAHDPYPKVPGDVRWLPARPSLQINPLKIDQDHPARRYVEGKMTPAQEKEFLAWVVDGYDWGISRADKNIARTIEILQERHWLDEGFRAVITSDHGEHLGEHHLVRHDGPPWESVSRVFTIVIEPGAPTIALPEPFANTMVFHLTKDGRLPDPVLPVAAASIAYDDDTRFRHDAVAVWSSLHDKVMWHEDQNRRYDPTSDPREVSPAPVAADDPMTPELTRRHAQLLQSKARALGQGPDPDMMQTLQAIGYLD
jgi:predicted AlkP superfamily pyrophosphatase or phosphodiesterase